MYQKISEELLTFLRKSPSCFQAADQVREALVAHGFQQLKEDEKWNLEVNHSYFTMRNSSSVIAFTIPENARNGYRIMASHSDSPTFKIKENPEMAVEKKYVKLNVERYGGMLCAPWFDRPLSIAGRVITEENGELVTHLVNVDRDLVLIPNLAIHMNREVNDGYKYNAQKDMLPLYGDITAKDTFMKTIAEAAGVKEESILGHDLFLYNRQPGTIWGASNEFVSSGRLDDLQCAFSSLQGFLRGDKKEHISLFCLLDNEEVGSGTKQGAASTFLYDTLMRINASLDLTYEDYLVNLAKGFMISADNAHAIHPNHTDMADPVNRPYLNEGIVIKFNANQKYCTDGVSAAMFKSLCKKAGVPYQTFTNRSDILGGSTLGNISNTKVALNTVDIGLPQLAMHSPYETAGVKDTWYLIQAVEKFYC
ncbi:MAG TPA: M18 family aminopeptidase [Candidatus Blautia intestinigallinarum]|nr:M18 family aminopeptidase [Candidatus Blautia intestinigallinarum]